MPTRKPKSERDVKALARGHTASMVRVLAGIATSAEAQAGARVSAATALLDRGWGKPEQHTQIDVTHDVTAFLRDLQGQVIDSSADTVDTDAPQLVHDSDQDEALEVSAPVMAGDVDG